jgi:hypothetical protein
MIRSIRSVRRLASTYLAGFALSFALAFSDRAALAQDATACPRALEMARTEFEEGYFDRSSQRLSVCLERDAFSPEEEREAYLLLGMIYYANLQIDQARDSLRLLLERDPSMELKGDQFKQGFVDLFDEVRNEMQPVAPTLQPARSGPHRSGLWVSVGAGPGGTEFTCRACDLLPEDDPWRGGGGPSIALSMGGSVSENLLVGGEFSHWERRGEAENTRSAAISTLTAVLRYYPITKSDFFVKSGLGIGSLLLEGDAARIDSGGLSVQLGFGYDLRMGRGRRFALTPFGTLHIVFAEGGRERVAGVVVTGPEDPSFVQLGIAATWF